MCGQNIISEIRSDLSSKGSKKGNDRKKYYTIEETLSGSLDIIQTTINSSSRPSPLIYELIQNADDANANNLEIFIDKNKKSNKLIFIHDGDKFDDDDIASLCSIGQSNKSPKEGKIGYFGIGFKSVFLASKNVEVKSGDYHFSFRKDKKDKDNIWMILPKDPNNTQESIDLESLIYKENDSIKNFSVDRIQDLTFFVLHGIPHNKIKDCEKALLAKNDNEDGWNLKSRSVLFLNTLNNIKILQNESAVKKSKDMKRKITKEKINKKQNCSDLNENISWLSGIIKNENCIYKLKDTKKSTSEKWLIIEKDFKLDKVITNNIKRIKNSDEAAEKTITEYKEQLEDEKKLHNRKDVEERSITVGFRINGSSIVRTKGAIASAFYSGAKTDQIKSGLNYLVSADFLFSTSRDEIEINSLWNKIMAIEISKLLKQIIKDLAKGYREEILEEFNENNNYEKYDYDLQERKRKIKEYLPRFLSIILDSKSTYHFGRSIKNFFNKYISVEFTNRIQKENIIPSFDPKCKNGRNIFLSKPPNTYFFWPEKGYFCNGKSGNDIPREIDNLFEDIQSFIDLNDIENLYENYRKNKKNYDDFNEILNSLYNNISDDFWHKISSKNFILPAFLIEYAKENDEDKKGKLKSRIDRLGNLSSELFDEDLDILHILHTDDFVQNKKKCLKDNYNFIKWLIKLYGYLQHLTLPQKIKNRDSGNVKKCLKIFYDEKEKLRRLGGCNIENLNSICPYDNCNKNTEHDLIYKPPDKIKDQVKGIAGNEVNFLNTKIKENFEKYKGENYKGNEKRKADLGNYYINYRKLLRGFDIKKAPQRKIINSLFETYSNSKEIECSKNELHVKLLTELWSDIKNKSDSLIKDRISQGQCLIKLKNKKNEYERPENLLFSKEYFKECNNSNVETSKNLEKSYTLDKYIHADMLRDKKEIGLEDYSFLNEKYLSHVNSLEYMINFFEFLDVGLSNLDESEIDKGRIGEKLVKFYYEQKNPNKYIIYTEDIKENYKGYDIAILDELEDLYKDIEKELNEEELNWLKQEEIEKLSKNTRNKLKSQLRELDIKKIEVKFTTNSLGEKISINQGQVENFDKVRGKKNDDKEPGRFFLSVIYNGFLYDKLILKEYRDEDIGKLSKYLEQSNLQINFQDEFADSDRDLDLKSVVSKPKNKKNID